MSKLCFTCYNQLHRTGCDLCFIASRYKEYTKETATEAVATIVLREPQAYDPDTLKFLLTKFPELLSWASNLVTLRSTVKTFTSNMLAKLRDCAIKGKTGWDSPDLGMDDEINTNIRVRSQGALTTEDVVDIANYCVMRAFRNGDLHDKTRSH